MNVKKYLNLFGGQTSVSRILGMTSPRQPAKWANDDCIPQWAVNELRVYVAQLPSVLDGIKGINIKDVPSRRNLSKKEES
jgi:hypothetical protein